jgi:single-stranded-DNA-specific exonuclease
MDRAVDRLLRSRRDGEHIVIFGDYDVDGVTSTALLLESMRVLGWTVSEYLPSRMDEGYGLSRAGVANCLTKFQDMKLLLAVDCGSTSVDAVAQLGARGVDVVVVDHHHVSDPAPNAVALVNPLVGGDGKFTELCSVGLAFKLVHALVRRCRADGIGGADEFDLRPLLDLVALGTIADVVPLVNENRILAAAGLAMLNQTTRPGLVALRDVSQCRQIGTYEVGFLLGPRLNAAGRLETAADALALLNSKTMDDAMPLAVNLDRRNRERQNIERTIAEEALRMATSRFDPANDYVIVESGPSWHVGVVGIVASRMMQRFYRPSIIIGREGDDWRGSGRSIAGFDMANALIECSDLLIRHGGHAMAAGISISPDKIDAFRERLNDVGRRVLAHIDLQPPLRVDAEVTLKQMTLECVQDLDALKPTGQGNPDVQFVIRGLEQCRIPQRMGKDGKHVKMWVSDGAVQCEAVLWGAGNDPLPTGRFDMAFSPKINEFNGRTSVQLKVSDWRPFV